MCCDIYSDFNLCWNMYSYSPNNLQLERAKQRIKDLLKHHPDLERACTNADVVRYIADADEDGVGK